MIQLVIADDSGVPKITDPLRAELDRRIAAFESDPTNVITWEQIEAKLIAASGNGSNSSRDPQTWMVRI